MFFDTHAHYDAEQFQSDREELLGSLPDFGVSLVLNPGCDLPTSQQAVHFSEKFPHVYSAVGIHPSEVGGLDLNSTIDQLKSMGKGEKVMAIGEIGLDYYWEDNPSKEVQHDFFNSQMLLAKELSLPVIIHDREAHGDSLEIVQAHKDVLGVFHCYAGSVEMSKKLLDLGYYLSFTGVVTYKNARKTLEVLEYLPLDRIMLETDSPYLSPVPNRGKRNDSRNLQYIAQVVADIKGISLEECARITMENGKRCFHIA